MGYGVRAEGVPQPTIIRHALSAFVSNNIYVLLPGTGWFKHQAHRPEFVQHPMFTPFFGGRSWKLAHACSMSPYQAVDEWGFAFLFRPIFLF